MSASFSSESGPSTTTVLIADMFSDATCTGNDFDGVGLWESVTNAVAEQGTRCVED